MEGYGGGSGTMSSGSSGKRVTEPLSSRSMRLFMSFILGYWVLICLRWIVVMMLGAQEMLIQMGVEAYRLAT